MEAENDKVRQNGRNATTPELRMHEIETSPVCPDDHSISKKKRKIRWITRVDTRR